MWDAIKQVFGVTSEFQMTTEYEAILKAFDEGNNLFITGKAGTGKSKLVEYLRSQTEKNVAVVAPTGLAALQVNGSTIHSLFKFPARLLTPESTAHIRADRSMFRQLDVLIIDEASMLRADVFDAIDRVLRKYGKHPKLPFGGLQIVLVGDLFQLPPVVTSEEAEAFHMFYEVPCFFGASAWRNGEFVVFELTQVFRQTDLRFIETLNAIRTGSVQPEQLAHLNLRSVAARLDDSGVLLAPTNKLVYEINMAKLAQLPGREQVYLATTQGEFGFKEGSLPAESELRLKKGAQVMLVKNGEMWVNGSLGTVESMGSESVSIRLHTTGTVVEVIPETWNSVEYSIDAESGRLQERIKGSYVQLPIRLAWAVTIHKSQGMTFSSVYIDFSKAPFAHGQTYVALSRCQSLEGISLSRPVYPTDVIVDPRIVEFLRTAQS